MLTIYKASAGSGKTFTLVLEYFILIFSESDGYKNTLAVTFTNKATEEMKLRIIEELYILALGNGQSKYETDLLNHEKLIKAKINTKQALYSKAKELLKAILHDYSKLSVTTIDRFFQKLIRSFIRELKQSPSYAIELDTDNILAIAVQRVIDRIPNEPSLQKWVNGFINNSIDKFDKIQVNNALTSIGKTLFSENTMEIEKSLFTYNANDIDTLYKEAVDFFKSYEEEYSAMCNRFFETLFKEGFEVENLSHKRGGGASPFLKGYEGKGVCSRVDELNSYFMKTLNRPDGWFTKEEYKKLDDISICEKLTLHSKAMYSYIETKGRLYNSYKVILTNLYNLGLIKCISDEIDAICKESDTMLLSNTTKLLGELINNTDTPFIYEKMGNYYSHIMIDEFQDTSKMQWNNFKPLIENSIAHGKKSLIVGDIKQSIYKFRNGDWRLLAQNVYDDFKHQKVQDKTLDSNWRSCSNIVNFNNEAFPIAVSIARNIYEAALGSDVDTKDRFFDKIIEEYNKGRQIVKKESKGRLGFYFTLQHKNGITAYINDEILERVSSVLSYLNSKGAKWGDCAILVSSNKEASLITNKMIEMGIPFVSNDSLVIENNVAVQFIIAALKYMQYPTDIPNKATLLSLYYKINDSTCPEEEFLNCNKAKNLVELLGVNIDEIKMRAMSLYDIVEYLIATYNLGVKEENVNYLVSLQDIIFNFTNRNSDSISEFIEKWNQSLREKTVTLSENKTSVKIMTIHSSKGLQFKHVIIPFFNWEFSKSKGTIWVDSSKLSDKIKYIPISFTAEMKYTIFEKEYQTELSRNYIDRLNLLYVALTRPVESLHICSTYNSNKKNKHNRSNDLLKEVLEELTRNHEIKWDSVDVSNTVEWYYELGDIELCNDMQDKDDTNSGNELKIENYTAFTSAERFVIKSTHDEFIQENTPRLKAIDEGKLQHYIMQHITDENSVQQGIEQAIINGLISAVEYEKYYNLFETYMNQVRSKGWFAKGVKAINERELILKNKQILRPDRVVIGEDEIMVIDFKFGVERKEYIKQIQTYCNTINDMGRYNKAIKGYIWYPILGKIVSLE